MTTLVRPALDLRIVLACPLWAWGCAGGSAGKGGGAADDSGVVDRDHDGVPASEDCDDHDPDHSALVDWFPDLDHDGYGTGEGVEACTAPAGMVATGGDCDDGDEDVHPLQDERCNGVDDDCDGSTDDSSSVDAAVWYPDLDLDTHGALEGTQACFPPEGSVAVGDDCDDTRDWVHPEAPEVCDPEDRDENCNGSSDDLDPTVSDATLVRPDLDGDHFSDDHGEASAVCDPPEELSSGDCDDHDASVHPGAEEICNDRVDNDCDGGAGPCGPDPGTLPEVADLVITGPSAYARLPTDLGAAGDNNGDGQADLVLGSAQQGHAYLILGPLSTSGDADDLATAVVSNEHLYAGAGVAVDGVGDLDGDGKDELAVSAPWTSRGAADDAGVVAVFAGPTSGALTTADGDLVLRGRDDYDRLGLVTRVDDLDDDGLADLAVAAANASATGLSAGSVYLLSAPDTSGIVGDVATYEWRGPTTTNNGDLSTLDGGDMDGDGLGDLLVTGWVYDTGSIRSYAALVLGPGLPDGALLDEADGFVDLLESSGGIADAGAFVGDLDGDGRDDVAAGHPDQIDGGRVYLWLGNDSGSLGAAVDDADVVVTPETASDELGASVSAAGDVDGDGTGDLLVGARNAGGGGTDAGAAYLVYGPWSGSIALGSGSDLRFEEGTAGAHLGWYQSLLGGVDWNGDGVPDLALGSSYADDTATEAGRTSLVWGGGI